MTHLISTIKWWLKIGWKKSVSHIMTNRMGTFEITDYWINIKTKEQRIVRREEDF